jgi:hypothetical protein
LKAAIPNNVRGLSFEAARVREAVGGGGGKACVAPGSGDDLNTFAGDTRVAGDIPEAGSSLDIVDVR